MSKAALFSAASLALFAILVFVGCRRGTPVSTNYNYAYFEADPAANLELYIGTDRVGRLPFYISAEDLARHVQDGIGVKVILRKDEFFVSHHQIEPGGTFEGGPHFLYLDQSKDRFRILQKGQPVDVQIKSVLYSKQPAPSEYRFTVRLLAEPNGGANAASPRRSPCIVRRMDT